MTSNNEQTIITTHNLTYSYQAGTFQLRMPDLNITQGQRLAIVGPSGCGKTTFLKLLAGILTAKPGMLLVNNTDLATLNDKARRNFRNQHIGFIFQEFELIDYLSAWENLLLPFRINPALKLTPAVKDQARQSLAQLGLADKSNAHPQNLSQGEKQRLAIARALINKPKFILADEPTGNLDPKNKQQIKTILFEQTALANTTLIFITHDHSLLDGFDKVIDFAAFPQEVSL